MAEENNCNNRKLTGIVKGTNFRITFSNQTGASIGDGDTGSPEKGLVQQFQLQFQRKLSRVYDLASDAFYYIEGPAEGTVAFTKVVGPQGLPELRCDCTPQTITLNAGQTFCYPTGVDQTGAGGSYVLDNALGFGLNGQGDANNFLVVFGISYMFSNVTVQ